MCGIVGFVDAHGQPASPVVLRRMTEALRHRGPDGEGFFVDGALALGHRRLAIIDPTPAGHQPMETADGRFVLTYNGEVYNFQEIKLELEASGHRFHSRTDTEVVLEAFAEWGLAALPRFNGFFAFAVWDRERRELTLARDRYGIKPLYWACAGTTFMFASEVKALLEHPAYRVRLDENALIEYLTFQNVLSDRTLFRGVRTVPAGTVLTVRPGEPLPEVVQWWDFDFREPDDPATPEEYLEELERLFEQAVNRSLVADVAVGSYLSGGLDSGAIAAVAAAQIPQLRTFTVGFDMRTASGMELAFDERATAEYMSYLFKTEQYEMVLKSGDMERVMPQLTWHLEDLRIGQSYPNFCAAQLASKFGKVVLSGAAGDELFGGYPWRYYRAVVNESFDHYIDTYYAYWQRLMPPEALSRVLRPTLAAGGDISTRSVFEGVFAGRNVQADRPEDWVNHSLYFEAKTFLHGILVVEDKISMAHSLEARPPFLDNDLVAFAQSLPVRLKLGALDDAVRLARHDPGSPPFASRSTDGKLLLRRAMRRFVPDEVAGAAKQGFSAPDASWFRGESIDYVRRRLMRSDAAIFEFLDREAVQGLVGDHLEGGQNRRLLIWSLLSLEQWCDTFLLGSRSSHPANKSLAATTTSR